MKVAKISYFLYTSGTAALYPEPVRVHNAPKRPDILCSNCPPKAARSADHIMYMYDADADC